MEQLRTSSDCFFSDSRLKIMQISEDKLKGRKRVIKRAKRTL